MSRVAARTAEVVAGMVAMNRADFTASGFDLLLGWDRFVEPRVIEVKTETSIRRMTGDGIYLNLGTKAAIPAIAGLREADPLTHVEALRLDVPPTRLLVIGSGYIGMELAQAFRHLGNEVMVIEAGTQLAAREDPDVAAAIGDLFSDDGIEVLLNARIDAVYGRSGFNVSVRPQDGRTFTGPHVLVATGRTPMTASIGLDIAAVELAKRNFVRVDETLETRGSGIWAMGEVAGSPMFTHVSLDDYRVAKSGIEGGIRTTTAEWCPMSCSSIRNSPA